MLIGLTGYAQHGKDTVGNYLVENYDFTRYAFADQLKSMALALNPIIQTQYALRLDTYVQDHGWDEAKKNPEVRRFLQVLGTEGVRDHLGDDAWIHALVKKTTDDKNWDLQGPAYGARIVVTDIRFPNEARFIKVNGGELWRVKRITKKDGKLVDYDNGIGTDHPSEKYISALRADRVLIADQIQHLYLEVDENMKNRRSA